MTKWSLFCEAARCNFLFRETNHLTLFPQLFGLKSIFKIMQWLPMTPLIISPMEEMRYERVLKKWYDIPASQGSCCFVA